MHLFRKLYSKPPGDFWRIKGFDWSLISGESVSWLDCPFSEEEVHFAIFQLDNEKALGLDGFTIAIC